MKIYISGAITGTTDYMERFTNAETTLSNKGYSVLNPAKLNIMLPEDTTHEEYMMMSLTMLSMCDAIYMLTGWQQSRGANMELGYAKAKKLDVIYEDLVHKIGFSSPSDYIIRED